VSDVRIENLTKCYGDTVAVAGIDLNVREGELVVLLGPSGCGKTSTLRCIAGLENIDGGTISIGSEAVSTRERFLPPEKRPIGMVFQSYAIWPHLNVFENVAFPLRLRHVGSDEVHRRVDAALALCGLEALARRDVSALSGGQQQRVAVSRAIVGEPRVLLFDEPLSNLDATLRERMRFELRQLQQRLGTTSIYVTHDQQEAMVIADRIVLMQHGRIVQMGSPTEIYNEPSTRFAAEFIGLANILQGQVIAAGEFTRLRLDSGAEMIVARSGFPSGQRVHAVVRPEFVQLSAEAGTRENTYPAKVTESIFLGNLADTYVDAGGLKLRAQPSPARLWPREHAVHVHIPPEHVVLIADSAITGAGAGATAGIAPARPVSAATSA
jgi:iron(III) transport system ATP-binding protein/putative spermidine/putrescine transport system ATP-binding protein